MIGHPPRSPLFPSTTLFRSLELALRMDHLGPPLALGLRLTGHRTLHAGGDLDVLDLHRGDLHAPGVGLLVDDLLDRKSTRLNSSHANISYAVFCLKKKKYR